MSHHPTPDLSHLKSAHYRNVYEPAEDTFLFLDSLEKDVNLLRDLSPLICLEIGSGSGCVSTFLATLLGHSQTLYLATDINPHANDATRLTGAQNRVPMDVVRADLFPPFRSDNLVDLLLFNPPYVVTPSEEVGSHSIEASWAGGVDGREVIDRVLPLVPRMLSPRGLFYMVVINENRPEEISERMRELGGYTSDVVMTRRAGSEGLSIMRFRKDHGGV
ncbi:HemK methyltransferase member 2 [Thoreauomyces humboldtii]|nr:HemK methyltransferase member 2 [Thoreauomyces humboldtii]